MQPKDWINFFFWIVFALSGANLCCINKVDAARAANTDLSTSEDKLALKIPSLGVAWIPAQSSQERAQKVTSQETYKTIFGKAVGQQLHQQGVVSCARSSTICVASTESQISRLYSQVPPEQPPPPTLEQNPVSPTPEQNSIPPIQQRLPVPEADNAQRLERLLQRLQEQEQSATEPNFGELGKLMVRERQLEQLPLPQRPERQPRQVGYLQAHVGYFQTSNIFSSKVNPIEDGLFYSGLTLASTPLPLGRRTFLNGSISGNLIRYLDQSKYNYNQVRFNVGVYQQLSPRMYGEIGWSNQQLFYARNGSSFDAGDRFLNENSFRLSLGRRDPLTPKLMLDSFYELRLSLTDPPSNQDNRDRVINSVWVSLNYYLKQSLQVGVDYQFGLSNFTQRPREDLYHRLYGHLTYGVSDYTNLSLQGGYNLGSSTENNIDFDGWFFSINYNLELGRF
ncbi:hypothetical protein BZZ01_21020 [Nostocales cyanobacterium HT-58-2]|nr:hypothetical protein BZZ01_21020 [Nostocales cyanobacterium HT-58-2]